MSEEDFLYYQGRAEREIELARQARHSGAARAHSLLAGYYLDMIYNGGARSLRHWRGWEADATASVLR